MLTEPAALHVRAQDSPPAPRIGCTRAMTWNIEGKRVLITGGTTGIGRATVTELARRGAEVIFTARSPTAGDEIVAEVASTTGNSAVSHRRLDLDDLGAVRTFAAQLRADIDRLDVLVNNAGVVLTERRETVDGHEFTFGVNHLGHFALVQELQPLLEASSPARLVVVASDAHKFVKGLDFDDLQSAKGRFGVVKGLAAYSRSKLANMLFTRELARRVDPARLTVNCLHPGAVSTRLGRDGEGSRASEIVWPLAGRFLLTPEQGARTSVWAVTSPELSGVTGEYFAKEKIAKPRKTALDDQAAARLWTASEALVAG
ncbi:MAG: SDR family oxidoreductase [Acidimicrobiales bacterium]